MAEIPENRDMSEEAGPSKSQDEKTPDEGSGNNWSWGSWITSAKSKSAEVYSMVKKDLDEIGTAVKSEASHVINTTSNVLGKTLKLDEPESPANAMKKSFSSFIDQMNTVLNPAPDDEDTEAILVTSDDSVTLSTYQRELEALQRVDATFLVPVEGPAYSAWLDSHEETPSAAAYRRRLQASTALQAQYNKLVPDAVTEHEFWDRYLFRVALLQDRMAADARRRSSSTAGPDVTLPSVEDADPVIAHLPALQLKDTTVVQQPSTVLPSEEEMNEPEPGHTEKDLSWEEDFVDNVELTEEQQTQLLLEYEKEIATKKTKPTQPSKLTNRHPIKLANKDATKLANKDATKLANKESSKLANKESAKLANKESTKLANKESTKLANKESTKLANKESTKLSNKNKKQSKDSTPDIIEDHFLDKDTNSHNKNLGKSVIDDASSNSDESWEKEFDVEEKA